MSRKGIQARLLPAVLAIVAIGCASGGSGPVDLGDEVRPDASPEYDVLVAQQHASEGRMAQAVAAYQRAVAKDDDSAYLHRLVADALARTSELDAALVHAERAYELEPEDRLGRSLLAQLYRVRREPERAATLLVDESGAPVDAEAAPMLYQIHLEMGRPQEALGVAQWMLEHDTDRLRAQIAVANAYEKLEQPEAAERALREALEIEPDNLRLYGALARMKRIQGDRDGEIAIYREILEADPDDQGTLAALADAQLADEDLDGAIVTLQELERRYPDNLRATVRLGFLYYEARRFVEAAERFERVLEETPTEFEISFFLGVAHRREKRDDEALRVFASIPSDHKHYSEARTQMAAIHERRGEYALAREEIDRAIAVEPSRPLELYSATLRSKAGDFEGSIAYLEGLLAEKPEDDELIYNLGVVYGEAGEKERAVEYMQRALERNPENASALNYIGYTWAEQGIRLDEAEDLIHRAIALRPEDGYIVDSLAWVYYMRARPLVEAGKAESAQEYIDRAISELERANELTGGDPVISEHLGDTYMLLDEPRRALDMFLEAVDLGIRADEQPNLQQKLDDLRRELE